MLYMLAVYVFGASPMCRTFLNQQWRMVWGFVLRLEFRIECTAGA